jgi:hypothetical protein
LHITEQDLQNCGIQKTGEELDRFLKHLNNVVEERIINEYYDDDGSPLDDDEHIDRHIEDIPDYKKRIEKETAEILNELRKQVNDFVQFITDENGDNLMFVSMRIEEGELKKLRGDRVKSVSGVILIGKICSEENAFITSFTSDGIKIKIPEGVVSIRKFAFIENPYSIAITPLGAPKSFLDCVTEITLPDSLTKIGRHAFAGCHNLTHVKLPKNLTSIGYRAFRQCENLISIEIPAGTRDIRYEAFPWHFTHLDANLDTKMKNELFNASGRRYKVSDDVVFSTDGTVLYRYSPVKEQTVYVVPDSVAFIGKSAFANCKNLSEIIVPDSVTTIDDYAFSGCDNLKTVRLPDKIRADVKSCLGYGLPYGYWREKFLETDKEYDMNELLDIDIEFLKLSARSFNLLIRRASVRSIKDITLLSERELRGIRHLTDKNFKEITGKLAELGLSLKK